MLTAIACKNAKPGLRGHDAAGKPKPYKLTDSLGLYLLVQPGGSKLWQMPYRRDGKQRVLSLGRYPDLTLFAARAARDQAKTQLRAGIDPGMVRKAEQYHAQADDAETVQSVGMR